MFDSPPLIRAARADDLAAIQALYAHYVTGSVSSFELDAPSLDEMTARFESICGRGFPYLVAEIDGQVRGFAYANTYRTRPAYDFTVEDSVYIDSAFARRGLGRGLLAALIEACTEMGYRQMVAVIGDSANQPSIGLHGALGFERVGLLPSVGFKFDRWIDSVIMQRALGLADRSPAKR